MGIANKQSVESLRNTSVVLIQELKQSAQDIIHIIERLESYRADNKGKDPEELDDLEVELQVAATTLRLDVKSVEKVLEEITDAMPDDE